jgi:glycosyltransferase involved in cell wall biosynthesis
MRVILFIRTDAGHLLGGPTEQVRRYAAAIRERGGEAVVWASTEQPVSRFDVAHLLNLDWPLETARQFELARRCADKVVISPIYPRREWVAAFHNKGRSGLAHGVSRMVGVEGFKRLRNLRWAFAGNGLGIEGARQLMNGVANRQRQILDQCDAWFPLAAGEQNAVEEDFGLRARHAVTIPNGASWADEDSRIPKLPEGFVLSAGRIEAGKNQLYVAEALRRMDLPGVFVGPPNPRHRSYVRQFAEVVESSKNLVWLGEIPQYELLQLYPKAGAHVLASWFEVVPLVTLEAIAAGCPVVQATRSYADEYLGPSATYWDPPTGIDGLVQAIRKGLTKGCDSEGTAEHRERLDWTKVGNKLMQAYAAV